MNYGLLTLGVVLGVLGLMFARISVADSRSRRREVSPIPENSVAVAFGFMAFLTLLPAAILLVAVLW